MERTETNDETRDDCAESMQKTCKRDVTPSQARRECPAGDVRPLARTRVGREREREGTSACEIQCEWV